MWHHDDEYGIMSEACNMARMDSFDAMLSPVIFILPCLIPAHCLNAVPGSIRRCRCLECLSMLVLFGQAWLIGIRRDPPGETELGEGGYRAMYAGWAWLSSAGRCMLGGHG